jgi:outer membrane protein OmpA-like peptidoglycan-associated protein
MAEMMLLLLFCLLLVSGALLQEQQEKIVAAEQRLDELVATGAASASPEEQERVAKDVAELARLREEREQLAEILPEATVASEPIPDETWRELRIAHEIGQAMIDRGLTLTEVVASVEEAADAVPSPSGHDWPPMITLGSDEFRFVTSSAELSEDFRNRLETETVRQLRDLLASYDVDVIEVVGHTDEQPINSTQRSTLDTLAIPALNGGAEIGDLKPVDNAGLGLARAIAVAKVLEAAFSGTGVKIVPLSGAQLILPGDILSDGLNPGDERDRRRIELRVRRSSSAVEAQ